MKALVTGGCGFVGSHLVDRLLSEGHEVTILDVRRNDYWGGRARIVEGDIRKPEQTEDAADGVDTIFHLAAQVSVPKSIEDPRMDMATNGIGTLNVLEAARKADASVVYSSSAAVYGNPQYVPVDEKHPKNPISPYGVSKLAGEGYCKAYANNYGLKTAVARFSNVYGPRNPKAVIYVFIANALAGKPITIDGDGGQKRDFIYVKDIVSGLLAASQSRPGEAYNISTGKSTSLNELVGMLEGLIGGFEKKNGPARQGDIRESVLSSGKAKEMLGFRAEYGMEEALKETVEWAKSQA
ncbi:MAG: hypothetical protein DRO99_02420 [Candidatus Aenigmatarchaeota archaeon]|nr:MAG: hypothetical protein DRO99_02420 [Candidatus Aenigmarchaeota archaeon]